MSKSTCISLPSLAFPVTVDQTGKNRFTVTYGKQVTGGLDYGKAAREFGLCVFHALACDGKLDNSERGATDRAASE